MPRIYRHDWEIDSRLIPFDATRSELIEVVRGVVGARADAVEDDPATAEGLFAYIFGTRFIRGLFRSKGYMRHREENIESVRHPDRSLNIIYQSVDLAASLVHEPRAVSGKGSGSDRLIDLAQGQLFSTEELTEARKDKTGEINTGVWYFCVSVNGDDVRAELSLPASISGNNFKGYLERIFILRDGEWLKLVTKDDDSQDAINIEPTVSRK